jgi:hypothetical protein
LFNPLGIAVQPGILPHYIPDAFNTKEDFPHRLGEINMVFTDELKFETNLLVSFSRSVKSLS